MRGWIRWMALAAVAVGWGAPSALAAEKVTFEARSPLLVARGEPFRIEFNVDATPDQGTFEAPQFPEAFDILADHVVSTGHEWTVIDGQMTDRVRYTISYVLQPQSVGRFRIDAARIAVGGKTYTTEPLWIEVVEEAEAATSAQGSRQPAARQSAEASIGADDLFMRLELDRTTVYKGQPLRATFKIYKRVTLAGFEGAKFPSFNGFWAQQINTENNTWRRENYRGRIYETLVAAQYLLYPQQVGQLGIEPAEVGAVAQVIRQSESTDPLFGMIPDVYDIRRKLATASATVTVKPLPAGAPEGFSGAVGRFEMEATPPAQNLKANSAVTYALQITGTGNLPFVQAPALALPTSFEAYTVKTTESLKSSASGISGYRRFEYPFIARAEGEFTVPAVEFSYFDPEAGRYFTLASRPFVLEVEPDASGSSSQGVVGGVKKEEVKLLGQDIRFIKIGHSGLRSARQTLFASASYWIALLLLVALALIGYLVLLRRLRERRNTILVRGRRANKVALQRFRAAERYMKEGEQHHFYEEMLRALWGYMSDKLNIPVANLTRENVREELRKRGIAPEQSQRLVEVIATCEEAQYSPSTSARMNEVYAAGVQLLSRFEVTLKHA